MRKTTLAVHTVQFRSFACNYLAVTHAKTLRALGIGFFSIISGDSERECTGCTLSERPHERTEKDIPKVVSDG